MLPDPLHPAVVHFPVVLAALLPLAVAWGLSGKMRSAATIEAWAPALAIAGLLALSAAVAEETGEEQEEVVEAVVGDAPIEAHEEAAEALVPAALAVLAVLVVSLVPRMPRRAALALQVVALLGSGFVGALVWRVGRTGGELVYRHGAASAYARALPAREALPHRAGPFEARERDEDEHED